MTTKTMTMLVGGAVLFTVLMPSPAEALRGRCAGMIGIAHRGERTTHTENTVAAFLDARSRGADAVETDVRITADGRFMLMHATKIDRTTDGAGEIEKLDSSYVRSVRTNDGGKVPFLTEALHAMHEARAEMFIEMKRDDPLWTTPEATTRVKTFIHIIRKQHMSTRVTVTGPRRLLSLVRQADASIHTALKSPADLTADYVGDHADGVTAGYFRRSTTDVAAMHAAGLRVYMTSADAVSTRPSIPTRRYRAAVKGGYDGIYTNNTSRLVSWCSAQG